MRINILFSWIALGVLVSGCVTPGDLSPGEIEAIAAHPFEPEQPQLSFSIPKPDSDFILVDLPAPDIRVAHIALKAGLGEPVWEIPFVQGRFVSPDPGLDSPELAQQLIIPDYPVVQVRSDEPEKGESPRFRDLHLPGLPALTESPETNPILESIIPEGDNQPSVPEISRVIPEPRVQTPIAGENPGNPVAQVVPPVSQTIPSQREGEAVPRTAAVGIQPMQTQIVETLPDTPPIINLGGFGWQVVLIITPDGRELNLLEGELLGYIIEPEYSPQGMVFRVLGAESPEDSVRIVFERTPVSTGLKETKDFLLMVQEPQQNGGETVSERVVPIQNNLLSQEPLPSLVRYEEPAVRMQVQNHQVANDVRLFYQARDLEATKTSTEIRQAIGMYRDLIQSYPFSNYYDEAIIRIQQLERQYVMVR